MQIDYTHVNTDTRVGRQIEGLIESANRKAKVVVTVDLAGAKRYHQTFQARRWENRDGHVMLTLEVKGSGDYDAGIRPIKVCHINIATGSFSFAKDDRNADALLRYAAQAALRFAFTGEIATPTNGVVTVWEEAVCGMCGLELTDPVSIERGIGPTCSGKATGTKTILGRTPRETYERRPVTSDPHLSPRELAHIRASREVSA